MSWQYFDQGYERTTDKRIIEILLKDLKENAYWVQFATAGFRSGPTILVKVNKNRLFFDLPRPWRDDLKIARVIYQDGDKIHHSFKVRILGTDYEENLVITDIPKEYFRLERRRFYRVSTPDGSKAIFEYKGNEYTGDVVDISACGMAIILPRKDTIPVGDLIENLVLKLNLSANKPYDQELRVAKARVAREMHRGPKKLYGIEFLFDNEREREPFLRYTIRREIELRKP
ncbi:flagellar brake protein [Thermodesulfatator autotrophicus]|uniref:PilZ domain-containing protein n=1 Tax=Thermodesulfatator autotrophicus TaxID=1795632 RepID=A0A177E8R0_9BACT|nr:PilZ domain-containing protein [Thermodesulfatator autotrophicus]OAG27800.1 hypothetical protein TH606_05000 [Thermodesulfatator autotrophicus]